MMINIDTVTRRFGRTTAVDGVSLAIVPGESVALWGANGAGKTTLIRCVLGLLRFRGRIGVGGFDVASRGKQSRMLIGYVPQELGFYDDLGVGEAVRCFARLKGVAVDSAEGVLAGVGLFEQSRKRVRNLSGGMKQRLALAIALLGDPPVLVLDEVTASLDACGREEFISLLSRLSGAGRTMLFASHRIDEVATLARRVVVLERGRIAAESSAAEFAGSFGMGTVLHLALGRADRDPAMALLRGSGFDPRLNGIGVVVPVQSEHKAVPFRLLADAGINVHDFEVLVGSQARAHSREQGGVQ